MTSHVLLDPTKPYKWIKAICVAKFDHELGMIVEETAPAKALTDQETKSVAMLSFPESNCAEADWEHTFFYRFRRAPDLSPLNPDSSDQCEYLFGYAYYIQRKDPSSPRGYCQKSFVIITPFYFSAFYTNLVQLIGRTYFSSMGSGFIQELYENTLTWPSLYPGADCEFHILTEELKATIPCDLYTYIPSLDPSSSQKVIDLKGVSIFQDISLAQCWQGASPVLLWNLWEIMITETPLLVIADTPAEASQMISSVISLMHPLKFMGDYRPYATMYDDDIKTYTTLFKEKKKPFVVIGTCNPYFPKILDNFPAVLHLEKGFYMENKLVAPHKRKMTEFLKSEGTSGTRTFLKKVLKTKERMLLGPNKELLEELRDGNDSEDEFVNNWLLRLHFKEMTWFFLSAFAEVLSTKTGLAGKEVKLHEICGKHSKFNEMYVKDKGKTEKLYAKFMQTRTYQNFLSSSSLSQLFN